MDRALRPANLMRQQLQQTLRAGEFDQSGRSRSAESIQLPTETLDSFSLGVGDPGHDSARWLRPEALRLAIFYPRGALGDQTLERAISVRPREPGGSRNGVTRPRSPGQ